MALTQVPQGAEVWQVEGGGTYLAFHIPGTQVPLVWGFRDATQVQGIAGSQQPTRRLANDTELQRAGAIWMGNVEELDSALQNANDPWSAFVDAWRTEAQVRPWLNDPEIMAAWAGAYLEGREMSVAEMQTTQWWKTRNEAERQWVSLMASDPQTGAQIASDNRLRVRELLARAGVENVPEAVLQVLSGNLTSGRWTEQQTMEQVRKLADPNAPGALDPSLVNFTGMVETTRQGMEQVRAEVARWLGPAVAKGWTDDQLQSWASKIRNSEDGQDELIQMLRGQRMALFPEYQNENLTYEDIAGPWRSFWQQTWGRTADEMDPLFTQLIQKNDIVEGGKMLRREGLNRGVGQVVNELRRGLGSVEVGAQQRSVR